MLYSRLMATQNEGQHKGSSAMDKYSVLEYLAEGGMGAIFVGKKMGAGGFERQVVLKQLLPEFTKQPEFIDLFLREARLSATLDHANIIHTIDLVTAGEDFFIVMEYLDGADLRALMKRSKALRKTLSPSACLFIAREMLSALAYAHDKRNENGEPLCLIHRDVSPSNILVSSGGEVKLTDFGIAKAATHNSRFYKVKGKVGYMSPEQARSEPIDARSDLYSLAVCIYEAMTGAKLFVNKGITTSADELYATPIPLLSTVLEGIPADLDKLFMRALSVEPDGRYQSAAEFQDVLLRCAYKNGLMISATQLAHELTTSCGPSSLWREENPEEAEGLPTEGTEQIDMADFAEEIGDSVLPLPPAASNKISGHVVRPAPNSQAAAKLSELKDLELTSMINLAAVENDEDDPVAKQDGEMPLVDFDYAERREVDSPPPVFQSASSFPVPASAALAFNDTPPPQILNREKPRNTGSGRLLLGLTLLLFVCVGVALGIGFTGPTVDVDLDSDTNQVHK